VAINVGFLWVRLGLKMVAAILSTRFALQALGVDEFGVYIAVTSLFFMFSFMAGAMQAVSHRSLTMNLHMDADHRRRNFNGCLQQHLIIAAILFAVGGTMGAWVFGSVLSIPDAVRGQAWMVFVMVMAASSLGACLAPYEALAQAYERFEIYAVTDIFASIAILAGTYWLLGYDGDRLTAFGMLQSGVSASSAIAGAAIIARLHPEARVRLRDFVAPPIAPRNWSLFSWMVVGSMSTAARVHGLAVLANFFLGPVASAVLGIANQLANMLGLMASAVVNAIAPRILKAEAAGETKSSIDIALASAKYTSFVAAMVAVPLLIEASDVLDLWLIKPPAGAATAVTLLIVAVVLDQLSASSGIVHLATGRVARYQLTCGLLSIAALPVSAVIALMGGPLWAMLAPLVGAAALVSYARIALLTDHDPNVMRLWMQKSVIPSLLVFMAGLATAAIAARLLEPGVTRIIAVIIASSAAISATAWKLGFNATERARLVGILPKWQLS
jgi:O-antigen/teichoic acid export membrane protein